jgi:hypothetical protein
MLGAALAIGQGLLGAYNAYSSGQQANDYQSRMEEMARNSPLYQGSKPINEYYQQALNRYNENPYQSQQYQLGAMNARQATAQGINALNDRRSAIGGISRLEASQNYSMQNLGNQVEGARNARFSQLGGATQMKNADLMQQFDINKMTPYNRMLQLQQLKTQAANDRYNAGLSMLAQGVSNAAQLGIADKMYNQKLNTNTNMSNPVKTFNYNSKSVGQLPYGVQSNGDYVPFSSYKPRISSFTGQPY